MIVDEAVEPIRDIGISSDWEENDEMIESFLSLSDGLDFEVFLSGRLSCRLLVPSCVYEGRLELTIFPSVSLQSLFLVANTPNPGPPASSSFSLWRAMCLSRIGC